MKIATAKLPSSSLAVFVIAFVVPLARTSTNGILSINLSLPLDNFALAKSCHTNTSFAYIIGGRSSTGPQNTVTKFDAQEESLTNGHQLMWNASTTTFMTSGSSGSCITTIYNDNNALHEVLLNDSISFATTSFHQNTATSPSIAVNGACMVEMSNNDVYLIGGERLIDSSLSGIIQKRVSGASSWINDTTQIPLNERIRDHACASDGTSVFIFGGSRANGSIVDTVYEFNPSTQRYQKITSMSVPRRNAAVVQVSSTQIWIIGGESSMGVGRKTIDIFHLGNRSITVGPSMKISRFGHRAVVLMNTLYVFGGKMMSSVFLNSIERISLSGSNSPSTTKKPGPKTELMNVSPPTYIESPFPHDATFGIFAVVFAVEFLVGMILLYKFYSVGAFKTFRIVSVTLPILVSAALFETLLSIVGITTTRALTNNVTMVILLGASTVPIIFGLLIVSSSYYALVVRVAHARGMERYEKAQFVRVLVWFNGGLFAFAVLFIFPSALAGNDVGTSFVIAENFTLSLLGFGMCIVLFSLTVLTTCRRWKYSDDQTRTMIFCMNIVSICFLIVFFCHGVIAFHLGWRWSQSRMNAADLLTIIELTFEFIGIGTLLYCTYKTNTKYIHSNDYISRISSLSKDERNPINENEMAMIRPVTPSTSSQPQRRFDAVEKDRDYRPQKSSLSNSDRSIPQGRKSPRIGRYRVGSAVEVFSVRRNQWWPGTVMKIEDGIVVVKLSVEVRKPNGDPLRKVQLDIGMYPQRIHLAEFR